MLKEAKVDDRLSPSQKEIIRNRRLSSNDRLPVHGESPGDTENRLTQTRRRRTARDRGGQTVRGSKLPKYNKHAEFGGVTYQKDLNPDKVSARRSELRAKRAKNNIRSFKEGKTFQEFIDEARRMRVLRTAHYTDRSTKRSMLDQGLRSGTRSDGTYHDQGMNVLYTTPSSRVGSDYGTERVNFKLVNPKVTRINSPKTYGSRLKDWMRNASDDDLAKNQNRPEDSFKQSRREIRGGAKVLHIPDAHGGHDEPKKGNKGSYILLDKEVANKSIDRNPQPIIRSKDKKRRTKTQLKKRQ